MSDLQTLIKKRASLKSKVTSFKNFLNQTDFGNEQNAFQLEMRNARFNAVIDDFDLLQTEIECLSENVDEQYAERESFERVFYEVQALAKSKGMDSVETGSVAGAESAVNTGGLKLPTIQLPRFDGEFDKWLEFKNTYESLIHKNSTINDIQKYHYLRAALGGTAAQVIKSIEFTAEHYEVAWEILTKRFNNNKILIQNHVKALFNIKQMPKESAKGMRDIVDYISKHLRSLNSLSQPTDQWDTLIIFIVKGKLDPITGREWEEHISKIDEPILDDLYEFLRNRADILDTVEEKYEKKSTTAKEYKTKNFASVQENNLRCTLCEGSHKLYLCEEFKRLSVREKYDKLKQFKYCFNCLRGGHASNTCKFRSCQKCSARHNTLLHVDKEKSESSEAETKVGLSATFGIEQTLLSTALVTIFDKNNIGYVVRILLDSGSQLCFISEDLCKRLKIKLTAVDVHISGLNNTISKSSSQCSVVLHSRVSKFNVEVKCIMLNEITTKLPSYKIDVTSLKMPAHIRLADPEFYKPAKIDVLLGANVFWDLVGEGHIKLGQGQPSLHESKFGWFVSGSIINSVKPNNVVACNFVQNDIQSQIAKFWELEEVPKTGLLTPEEQSCEDHYEKNTKRLPDGRFEVSIPLKDSLERLGDSFEQTKIKFLALERRLQRNHTLRERYVKFMREYESQGHMSLVTSNDKIEYFMPHHGVLREDSETTKLRVVFNASASTTTGISFNDLQMTGPVVQDDILSIILRFREPEYVITADVEKMYRQVLVRSEERCLQRIVWRENPNDVLKIYELNTVTYGTTSAPYLATRCIVQLATECESPDIAEIIRKDFYVDDVLTGANTLSEIQYICKTLSEVLKSAGFKLRKWKTNDINALKFVSEESSEVNQFEFAADECTKTLGLKWICSSDNLTFEINAPLVKHNTKRTVLSTIARVFDPLGLLSPCTVIAKMILQKLWLEKLSWDDHLPSQINTVWVQFQKELPLLNELKLSRHVICKDAISVELHGFSDSSEHAYGGCLYVRSFNKHGDIFTYLLCAKSKVAPLKVQTIPRLELCGALTLAKLTSKTVKSLRVKIDNITLWTDSTIVLGWLRKPPNTLKSFVSNRVAEIQELTESYVWRHVGSTHNPADLLSRGLNPKALSESIFWFTGPKWLSQEKHCWPERLIQDVELPDTKNIIAKSFAVNAKHNFPFTQFSKLTKIKRVVAHMLRFKNNCLTSDKVYGNLTRHEVDEAFSRLIKLSQIESFREDYNSLLLGKGLSSKSNILCLGAFIDKAGMLRVGGRLQNSEFSFNKKHPLLLSPKHHLTKLIVENEHLRLYHAGPQLLLATLRETFWPIAARNLVKSVVHRCIKCYRFKAKGVYPIMGNLPEQRVQPGSAFQVTGVDYAGPVLIKEKRGRGSKLIKSYVCLFVCFACKAIHLELVHDLSKDAFLLAFKRFISRRGKPTEIWSDNATNFVASSSDLRMIKDALASDDFQNYFVDQEITWHFIPARSPHFGGLWEAGVKSVKFHLKRVVGNVSLTFDELYTVLVQIEAILNSRPLSPLSPDPSELNPLTPAHFLLGKPLTSPPEPCIIDVPSNRLKYFQQVEKLRQMFWARWSREYICTLQKKAKWLKSQGEMHVGDMVLIREDNTQPLNWQLGRVDEVFKGKDGITRVANVITKNGRKKRPVSRLCPLPIDGVESSSFQGGGHVAAYVTENPSSATIRPCE